MRFSNKALRHWSLLTEGLLDRRPGDLGSVGGRGCGGGGKAEGTQNFFQKRLAGRVGKEGTLATSRLAPGWPRAWPVAGEFFLSLRLWNCFCSQPEQGSRGPDQKSRAWSWRVYSAQGLGEGALGWTRWPCVCPALNLSPPISAVGPFL